MATRSEAEGAAAWFFQANPDTWRIDDFLAEATQRAASDERAETLWRVKPDSYARFTEVGQPVYIWRAAGSGRHTPRRAAGIAARAHIAGSAKPRDDVDLRHRTAEGESKLQPRQVRVPIVVDFVLDRLITREALSADSDWIRVSLVSRYSIGLGT